jgi:hypothetical protein
MTLLKPFQRHLHLQMREIEKKLYVVRWIQFSPMKLESLLIGHMVANLWVAIVCSKGSLGMMVQLVSIRLVLWPRVYKKACEDYFDTYSPIVRLTTICVLLLLAASHDLLIFRCM